MQHDFREKKKMNFEYNVFFIIFQGTMTKIFIQFFVQTYMTRK